jgi:hypothetical protein
MCGKQPQTVSERTVPVGLLPSKQDAPKETFYVFRCSCGTTFTHSVRPDEPSKK